MPGSESTSPHATDEYETQTRDPLFNQPFDWDNIPDWCHRLLDGAWHALAVTGQQVPSGRIPRADSHGAGPVCDGTARREDWFLSCTCSNTDFGRLTGEFWWACKCAQAVHCTQQGLCSSTSTALTVLLTIIIDGFCCSQKMALYLWVRLSLCLPLQTPFYVILIHVLFINGVIMGH